MLEHDELAAAYALERRETPQVRMNFVVSLDGAATLDGRSGGLGDAEDQRVMSVLREAADVLLVGAGTVRAEGYGGVGLPLAVVSGSLDIDPGHQVFTGTDAARYVITHAGSPAARREALAGIAEVLVCGEGAIDLEAALAALAERGHTQVLCEGGPRLFGELVAVGLVDELCLSLSPVLVGGDAGRILQGASEQLRRMQLVHALQGETLLFLRYARATPVE
ncbi:dihydrofolate reductase family protein [Leifsonia sp. YIM 134122]|uniref:Dihydrofolate reductase family protein n=1 Tax=Leifsonia stereocauli TaxID=3134136 RepID=A0ABU9VYZ1_9MICO